MQYGLLTGIRGITEYILGSSAVPYIPYNESGSWRNALPRYEAQADEFESYGCTLWGAHNQIEIFEKYVFGVEPNYDEWFNFPFIPINIGGQDPQVTYDSIRKRGLVPARTVSVPSTFQEARDLSRITKSMEAKGLNWTQIYEFKHEWVWTSPVQNQRELLEETLKTSPIAVSVTAWHREGDVYVDRGKKNNHWCVCFEVDPEGHPWVFDTYDHSIKKLSKDHRIHMAKRIWMHKKTIRAMKHHVKLLERVLKSLKFMKPTLLDVAKQALGTDVTPQDRVPDEVACAETITTLLRKVYPEVPIIPGTWTLYEYLTKNFLKLKEPEEGCIAIAPTGLGNPGSIGHAWIVMENGLYASNNSFGVHKGKFTINYTADTIRKKYVEGNGFTIHYFKHM